MNINFNRHAATNDENLVPNQQQQLISKSRFSLLNWSRSFTKKGEFKRQTNEPIEKFVERFKFYKFTSSKLRFFEIASQKLGKQNIKDLTSLQVNKREKYKLFNTICLIGKTLSEGYDLVNFKENDGIYIKKVKSSGRSTDKRSTFSFALTNEDIYICIGDSIGKGARRLASLAYKVPQQESEMFKPFEKVVRLKPHSKQRNEILRGNNEMEQEYAIVSSLSKKCTAIISPFFTMVCAKNDKSLKKIAFQKLYQPSDVYLDSGNSSINKIKLLIDIAEALSTVHKQKFVHCDVKEDNILVEIDNSNDEQNYRGILADFGASVKKHEFLKTGTKFYLPPEALDKTIKYRDQISFKLAKVKVTDKLDSFGLGILILNSVEKDGNSEFSIGEQMALLENPDEANRFLEKHIQNIQQNRLKNKNIKISTLSPSHPIASLSIQDYEKEYDFEIHLIEIAHSLLKFNPKERISCKEAAKRLKALDCN